MSLNFKEARKKLKTFAGDCVPPGTEAGIGQVHKDVKPDIKPDVSMEDLHAKKGIDADQHMKVEWIKSEVCESRKKRRRQFKTLRRRFINPLTVKGRLLYKPTNLAESTNKTTPDDTEHSKSSAKSDKYRFLTIFNLPENWSEDDIKDFTEREFELVNNIEMLFDKDDQFIGTIQLEFESSDQCKLAKSILRGKEMDGKILEAYDSDDESDSDVDSMEPQAKRRNEGRWRPDIDIWEKDPKGLYGLKQEYLKVMGINLPIDRWVHVTNFSSTKVELREVMELAGEVMVCSVVSGQQKYAKVMYSHPLEAVQAVSMLHNRQYQGAPLKVVMDTSPDSPSYLLPNGLLNVGPGLGSNGAPLRDIVRHYERFVKGFHSSINSTLFHEPDESMSSSVTIDANFRKMKQEIPQAITNKFVPRSSQHNQTQPSPPISASNQVRQPVPQFSQKPKTVPVVFGPQFPGQAGFSPSLSSQARPMAGPSMRLPSCPTRPMSGPPMRPSSLPTGPMFVPPMRPPCPTGPMPGPPMQPPSRPTGPISGPPMGPPSCPTGPMPGPPVRPMSGPNGPKTEHIGPKPMSGPGPSPSPSDHVTMELHNLPLNTTFPLLSEKMGECGPVMSLQLTSPGCAIVQFSHRGYADRCFQQYNNACVLGNIIKVRYL